MSSGSNAGAMSHSQTSSSEQNVNKNSEKAQKLSQVKKSLPESSKEVPLTKEALQKVGSIPKVERSAGTPAPRKKIHPSMKKAMAKEVEKRRAAEEEAQAEEARRAENREKGRKRREAKKSKATKEVASPGTTGAPGVTSTMPSTLQDTKQPSKTYAGRKRKVAKNDKAPSNASGSEDHQAVKKRRPVKKLKTTHGGKTDSLTQDIKNDAARSIASLCWNTPSFATANFIHQIDDYSEDMNTDMHTVIDESKLGADNGGDATPSELSQAVITRLKSSKKSTHKANRTPRPSKESKGKVHKASTKSDSGTFHFKCCTFRRASTYMKLNKAKLWEEVKQRDSLPHPAERCRNQQLAEYLAEDDQRYQGIHQEIWEEVQKHGLRHMVDENTTCGGMEDIVLADDVKPEDRFPFDLEGKTAEYMELSELELIQMVREHGWTVYTEEELTQMVARGQMTQNWAEYYRMAYSTKEKLASRLATDAGAGILPSDDEIMPFVRPA
ncbi:hypothetical protein AOQ84DRAFT_376706 [Glonium stellatum]|uniref:Uncharacterized protein n=1 Tax=Glonium stellatum TaxID=574774 RepID=A0A8E2F121_9PEZI|nr:hypothetical protein AOQ84DRAFT_376706 [Glonium stellatum]